MKNILYVIAMEKEAKEISEKLELQKLEEYKDLKVYRNKNITLLIAGIGKQSTAINLTKYLENCGENNKPDLIMNLGYVGSTNTKIGTWVNVTKSYNYEWYIPGEQEHKIDGFDANIIKTINNSEIEKLPCYSAESFVTQTHIKEDVVFDMELHSIYMICCLYNIELISLKKVSDNLNLDDYYKNIDMKEIMELTSGVTLLGNI